MIINYVTNLHTYVKNIGIFFYLSVIYNNMENIMINRNDITMYANIQIDANDSNFAQKYSIKIEDEFLRKKLFIHFQLLHL
ncbi:MAG: hypothetical protein L6V95_01735 [Candidatus Melainabacteria bacterium]|nr:MAG: hypothetical protein L6V95_01735 [Candidatus Melainabacteria bacterium]